MARPGVSSAPRGAPETKLLDYQTHQRRLLPRLAKTYALHFALDDLKRRFVEGISEEARREVEGLAAGLKAYATWHATDTIQTCRECCGGQGYLAVNRFAALKADTDVFTTFEGDNVVLLQLVAKGLLSGYKRQFSRMGLAGLVRYVASLAATALSEQNPVITRRHDEDHLRSEEFHSAALRWREQHLLSSVARRLKRRLDAKVPIAEAMVEVQTHLVEAAMAHVESNVHRLFLEAVEGEDEADLRAQLETLRQLYRFGFAGEVPRLVPGARLLRTLESAGLASPGQRFVSRGAEPGVTPWSSRSAYRTICCGARSGSELVSGSPPLAKGELEGDLNRGQVSFGPATNRSENPP